MRKEWASSKNYKLPEFIFFSNYFYGICAVGLSMEASLQQKFPLNSLWYYFIVFVSTVLYYTYPYIRKSKHQTTNPRTNWYTRNYDLMRWNQIIMTIILLLSLALFLSEHCKLIWGMAILNWILVFIFPLIAGLYYGINFLSLKYNLRNTGWLKPFIIGFSWAGMVTVYPVLFYDIIHQLEYDINRIGVLLFLKNLMFVTVLCIMFDIKDYAADYIGRLKTFVVKWGLRRTIFYVLIPVSLAGLFGFIYYATIHQFSDMKVLLNVIPFLLLAFTAWSLRRRKPLLYYLVIIDGLLLVKAACGIIAINYF